MKRLNYYQVHKNKKPKKIGYSNLIRFKKYLDLLAIKTSESMSAIISFQYSLVNPSLKIGKVIVIADSKG